MGRKENIVSMPMQMRCLKEHYHQGSHFKTNIFKSLEKPHQMGIKCMHILIHEPLNTCTSNRINLIHEPLNTCTSPHVNLIH